MIEVFLNFVLNFYLEWRPTIIEADCYPLQNCLCSRLIPKMIIHRNRLYVPRIENYIAIVSLMNERDFKGHFRLKRYMVELITDKVIFSLLKKIVLHPQNV